MNRPLRVLIVEGSSDDTERPVHALAQQGYDVTHQRVQTAGEMRQALEESTWDVVLSDYTLPAFSGQAALSVLKECGLDLPFIMVSGTTGEQTAVAALKAGARLPCQR